MITEELRARIAAYVAAADEASRLHYEANGYTFGPPPIHRAEYNSAKWCKIVVCELREGEWKPARVYAFVCLQDGATKTLGTLKAGDIHKAASWSTPARHARGSVFAAEFGSAAGAYGPAYLTR